MTKFLDFKRHTTSPTNKVRIRADMITSVHEAKTCTIIHLDDQVIMVDQAYESVLYRWDEALTK